MGSPSWPLILNVIIFNFLTYFAYVISNLLVINL